MREEGVTRHLDRLFPPPVGTRHRRLPPRLHLSRHLLRDIGLER